MIINSNSSRYTRRWGSTQRGWLQDEAMVVIIIVMIIALIIALIIIRLITVIVIVIAIAIVISVIAIITLGGSTQHGWLQDEAGSCKLHTNHKNKSCANMCKRHINRTKHSFT